MRRQIGALAVAGSIAALTLASPANAALGTIDMDVYFAGTYQYSHSDAGVDYVCGSDGVITLTYASPLEFFSGSIDTVTRQGTITNGGVFDITLSGSATYGTIDFDWLGYPAPGVPVWQLRGTMNGVPDCAPTPVVGNHGEYVAGAVKAGVKGAALAAIAKDNTKVGPYPG